LNLAEFAAGARALADRAEAFLARDCVRDKAYRASPGAITMRAMLGG
jgi:hypothetical protein